MAKKLHQKVWVITADSESGDDYGPYLFSKKPSKKDEEEIVKLLDYEDGNGPGDYGSFVYLKVDECLIDDSAIFPFLLKKR